MYTKNNTAPVIVNSWMQARVTDVVKKPTTKLSFSLNFGIHRVEVSIFHILVIGLTREDSIIDLQSGE